MKCLAVSVHVMNLVILATIGVILYGCGGEGGSVGNDPASDSSASSDAAATDVPRTAPTSVPGIQCAHDGDVYICNGETCSPDATSEIVAAEESGTDGEEYYKSISIGGSVSIIAECGSNVSFNLTETENTTTTGQSSGSGSAS